MSDSHLAVNKGLNNFRGVAGEMEDDHDDYCLKEYNYLFKPDLLEGKVAFVTGGGSGIGFRITELLMRHGCNVVIASRKITKLKEVRETQCVKIIVYDIVCRKVKRSHWQAMSSHTNGC